ncbi:hypothetical protein RHGRI_024699 [Rhododendron griersonianum]|uniref:Ribonuclease n=1 Tax=Rhododendron griersonianum TaxID=479676 RepID=A0AAV6JD94_9ERIC|nr:hypothetical protein RHGRI_024699 [Rhododendron griersonianum]
MTSTAGATGWLRGKVKAVPSGDSLVIMGSSKAEIPPEKTITLSSLMAPKLARKGGVDEPFAWESREYLRKLCIGKDVTFRVDYALPSREFGSVFLGDKNVSLMVVADGWAKVREQSQQKGDASPFLAELLRLEEQAKQQGLGRWSKAPGASEAAIRNLPPSAIGDDSNFDAMGFLNSNRGIPMQAIVEHVRDGSSLRVYLLPEFQFVQVLVAGIQAPSMGRRAAPETFVRTEMSSDDLNGESSAESHAPLTSAQRLAAGSSTEVSPDSFGREAKHFTEIRVLNREVRIVLEGVDKFSNLIGSVYYPDGESAKDLALELIENGLAKYVEWSASMMEEDAKRRLKSVELEAKKTRLRLWTNYVPPATNSKAIHDQNFTGKVVEVVSGDCVIVADDSVPYGSPLAERRVNLSSIKCPKMGNPRRDEKPAPYAREAKELLRTRLIGRQVNVSMEYSRKVGMPDGPGASDSRVMDFGSVFLASPVKVEGDDVSTPSLPTGGSQQAGANVAELLVARGYAYVIRHRDFEERSNYYDALLSAESRAIAGKKAIHSSKDSPVMHVADLTTASAKKTKDFLPYLQRKRMPAVVEYVLSGHRFKLLIPKETCSIAFSLSGVRCPGRNEPFSDEAIALMRRKIMQRDVEIEVETVDRTGTFLGSLWESRTNMAVTLLEAGLAKLQTSFGTDRIQDAHLLAQAEQSAKRQKLKIWENFVEGEEVPNGSTAERKHKEELKVTVTDVLGGGKFYVQIVGDQKVASIQQQLASLSLKEAPIIGAFNPKKGDIVLAQFSEDNSWNRAMVRKNIVNAPRGVVESPKDKFEVFYIDYGNQEVVTYSQLRPIDPSMASAPGLAQLCSLAYMKVPSLEEDYGQEAAERLSDHTLRGKNELKAIIEDKDTSGGKVKGQGTGTILMVTLIDTNTNSNINAALLKEGLARLEKRKKWERPEKQTVLDELETYQTEARKDRLGMWEYGDIQSDEEDNAPPLRKAVGKK